MKIGIKKLTIFALSFVMIVFCIFASVFSPNYTLKKSLVNAEEMQEENVIQPRSVIGAIGGAVMVFRCVEYLGKTVKTLNAVADSISAGDSFKDVCNTAIDTFIGRSSADQPTTPGIDYSQKLYEEMTYEIKSINKKIDGLEDDLQDINKSIGDLANVIVTESNKEYINDFRLNYVNLSNDMLREYDQLTASLNKNATNIDSAKLSYDDLYIAAYALNDMLFEYMTGNYRIDGLSIQDVMYEYISSVESLTATEKNERCIEFTEDLFASYALSQYCLLICRLYQLDYCNYYNFSEYVTQNNASESLLDDYIVSLLKNMNGKHEQIVTVTAKYIVNKGNSDMDMLYIPQKMPETYSLKYSEIKTKLYLGDQYYYSNFPEKYEYLFSESPLTYESSNVEVATVNDGEIKALSNGGFSINVKYKENVIKSYNFIVQDLFLSGGYGTVNAPYLIGSLEDLLAASKYNPSSYYKLISNISIASQLSSFCFPSFSGVFDGNGYTISNFNISDSNAPQIGFFGYVSSSAIIKNLTLSHVIIDLNATYPNPQNVGALAGISYGQIYNCAVQDVQIRYKSQITTSSSPLQKVIGGIVGYNYGKIENCQSTNFKFTNTITTFNDFIWKRYNLSVGGLVGNTTNGLLKNNLVVNPYIYFNRIAFRDIYENGYYVNNYVSLSYGFVIGTRYANPAECAYTGGTLNGSAYTEIQYLTGGTTSGLAISRYSGVLTSNLTAEELVQYRILSSKNAIDRNVYEEVFIANNPDLIKVGYGNPLRPIGVKLALKYTNGMVAVVPVTFVSGFDPNKLGTQTVTLNYRAGNGQILHTTIDVEVQCEHNWSAEQITQQPTCDAVGQSYKVCTQCGQGEYSEIAALGHSYGNWIAEIPATCESQGTLGHYNCSLCNKNFDEQKNELDSLISPALGHTESDWIVQRRATCFAEGVKYKECTICKNITASQAIEKLEHNIISYKAKAPTCTQSGWNEYEACANCGYSTYTEIAALGHSYGNWIAEIPATCESEGTLGHYNCSLCNKNFDAQKNELNSLTIVALKHNESDWIVQKQATCTAEGSKYKECTVCKKVLASQTIEKLEHNLVAYEAKAPTCTQSGWNEYEACANCGYSTYTEIAATGHSFGNWIAEIPATCESQGTLGHYNCSLCNKNFDAQKNELNSLIIVALKHNESDWIVQKQATCTAEGSKYKECTVCKKVLASQTIEKLEHNLVAYEAKAPTCTQSGWDEYEACANCGYSTYTEIAATDHNYEKVVTAPTCTQSGYTTYTCHCGNTYVDDYVSVTGHDYEKVVTAPTCTQSGYTTYTCHCGNTYVDDYVNATGHDYEKVVTAPTCTKGGYTTYVCSCGSTYVDDEVEPTGHNFGDWQETKAPTQTENGEKQRSCHCGKTEYEVIPAIGSNDNNSTAPDSSVNNDEGDKKTGCKSLISGEAANLLFLLCSSVIVFIKKRSYSL